MFFLMLPLVYYNIPYIHICLYICIRIFFIFFGFRTANCAYKAIGHPYIFDVNVSD